MVIGMVSGAVKFFFLFLDFFLLIYPLQYTSALPPMLFLLTHLSTSLPFIFFSSTCIFLYSSFFLLSFFFYSFCFPFLPSHEFFFFFFLFFPLFHFLFLLSKIFSELCQICSILLYTIISFLNPFVVLSAYFLFIHFSSFLVFLFLFSQFFNKL